MTALVEPAVEPALDVRTFLLGERGVEGLRESLREVGDLFEGGSPIQGAARRLVDEHLGEVAAGFLACVTQGRVFRVGGGQGSVRAALSVGGRCLLEREAPFDARLSVPLGPGMPLLGPPETPAVPSVVPGQPTRSG